MCWNNKKEIFYLTSNFANMKIVKSHGCYNYTTTVDGKLLEDISIEERQQLIEKLYEVIGTDDRLVVIDNLLSIIPTDDIIYEDGSCETCGHSMYDEIWEI